jgi:lysophospholipid acyltransferase (LPLAT)-like uncharacterized protein
MKLRNPWLIRIAAAVVAAGLWCWLRTLRFRRCGLDGRHHPTDPREQQVLYVFWHESIFGTLCAPGRLKALISQHADGELIARACHWLGLGTVRGSSTRGGSKAMQSLVRAVGSEANLAITPDGPRGPRRKMQPGAIWLASATGLPIVLIGIGYARAWRLNSWDQFGVPVPGSGVTAVLSQPIYVPADLGRDDLERWRLHLERELNRMNEFAEDWAGRIRQEGSRAAPPECTLVHPPRQTETTVQRAA